MKIKQLALRNFRGFKSLDIDFDPNLTVLVGLNGQGKSTVLDAVAIGFGPYLSPFEHAKDEPIVKSDVHLAKVDADSKGERKQNVPQLPASVAVDSYANDNFFLLNSLSSGLPTSWKRSLNTLKSRVTKVPKLADFARAVQQQVFDDHPVELPLLAFYGVERNRSKPQIKDADVSNRLAGYEHCFDARANVSDFALWLKKETFIAFEQQMKNAESNSDEISLTQQRLNQVEQALNKVLKQTGWRDVRYSPSAEEVCAYHDIYGQMPIDLLSDGVCNIIGMVGDIAKRAIQLNAKVFESALEKTTGIVLIDEVDLHLHPQWQQQVLQNLTEIFPNIQFIVTTHSPQVLTTVHKQNVRLLSNIDGVGQCEQPIGDTYGLASNDVLLETMNTKARPPVTYVVKLERYMALIDLGAYQNEEGIQLRKQLEQLLGAEHPEILRADRKIHRKGLKKS